MRRQRWLVEACEGDSLAGSRRCQGGAGSADYLLEVVARDLKDYGTFLRNVLRTLPGVTAVESTLSLREVKRDAGLPLL